ncbi:hypothetical protein E9993_17605 [Labilibacter sediminis]|nr:hypothetical protein E9993_17605 [Labilibacter sediminis]
MKNIKFYISVLCVLSFLSSCEEELEIWDSATLDYAGRYITDVINEAEEVTDITHREFNIYNTANNVENEFFVELSHERGDFFDVKFKSFVNGSSASFTSKSLDFANVGENTPAITLPDTPPTGLGEVTSEKREFIKAGIEEGKILLKAATSIGGNICDSLYLKVKFMGGDVGFVSYLLDPEDRENPEVEEFAWKAQTLSHDASMDTTIYFSGHRYTGFPEDDYH